MTSNIDTRGEWSAAIGELFIAFGQIEHITIAFLNSQTQTKKEIIGKSNFSKRVDLIVKSLKKSTDSNHKEFISLLKKAKELSKKRNLIAHNPLLLEVFQFADGSNYKREIIASSRAPKECMSLKELKILSNDASSILSKLYKCCNTFLP